MAYKQVLLKFVCFCTSKGGWDLTHCHLVSLVNGDDKEGIKHAGQWAWKQHMDATNFMSHKSLGRKPADGQRLAEGRGKPWASCFPHP